MCYIADAGLNGLALLVILVLSFLLVIFLVFLSFTSTSELWWQLSFFLAEDQLLPNVALIAFIYVRSSRIWLFFERSLNCLRIASEKLYQVFNCTDVRIFDRISMKLLGWDPTWHPSMQGTEWAIERRLRFKTPVVAWGSSGILSAKSLAHNCTSLFENGQSHVFAHDVGVFH